MAAGDKRAVEALMRSAATLLVAWQSRLDASALPPFDAVLLQRELALFPEWCVAREFGVQWNEAQQAQWAATCALLTTSALAQPTVAVHRDYMPRNLMVDAPPAPRRPHRSGRRRLADARPARLPGRGARPDQLRPGLAAA